MKYLKLFEEHANNPIREFFKDKINWKLFNFIETCMQQYNDSGYNLHIDVLVPSVGLKSSGGHDIYTNENEVDTPPEDYEGEYGDYEHTNSNGYIDNGHCEHIIKLFNKNNLIYTINMTAKKKHEEDEGMYDIMDSIVSKIQSKFNIEVYKFDMGYNFHNKPHLTYNILLK